MRRRPTSGTAGGYVCISLVLVRLCVSSHGVSMSVWCLCVSDLGISIYVSGGSVSEVRGVGVGVSV